MPDTTKAREILTAWLDENTPDDDTRIQLEYAIRHLTRAQDIKLPFKDVDTSTGNWIANQYKYLIWSDEGAGDDYACKCMIEDDPESFEDMSENAIRQLAIAQNSDYLADEKSNLNSNGKKYNIIAITEIHLWNATQINVELMRNVGLGDMLQLKGEDMTTFYGDGRDVRANRIHHDGTNRTVFKIFNCRIDEPTVMFKPGDTADEVIQNINEQRPGALTSVWPEVAKIYGWPVE